MTGAALVPARDLGLGLLLGHGLGCEQGVVRRHGPQADPRSPMTLTDVQ